MYMYPFCYGFSDAFSIVSVGFAGVSEIVLSAWLCRKCICGDMSDGCGLY